MAEVNNINPRFFKSGLCCFSMIYSKIDTKICSCHLAFASAQKLRFAEETSVITHTIVISDADCMCKVEKSIDAVVRTMRLKIYI